VGVGLDALRVGLVVAGLLALAASFSLRRHAGPGLRAMRLDLRAVAVALVIGVVVGFAQAVPMLQIPQFFMVIQGSDPLLATIAVAPFVVALIVALALGRTRFVWLAIMPAYATMVALDTGFSLFPPTVARKTWLIGVLAPLAGIAADRYRKSSSRITPAIVVATGLHRPNEGAELAELVGDPWVLDTVTVANHDARADEDHVRLGRTPGRGTVVRLDRRLVAADLKIATGLVEPHFMAGWSGGRKVIAPGVAHAETITTFHNAAFMAHPRAANCVLDGNPLHDVRVLQDKSRLKLIMRDGVAHKNTLAEASAAHEQRVA